MREIHIGSRIVYEHENGGLNALAVSTPEGASELISLVFIDPENGNVQAIDNVPNVYHAKDDNECSLPNGHWRR